MKFFRNLGLTGLITTVLGITAALAAGFYPNLPLVEAPSLNGVTIAPPNGLITNPSSVGWYTAYDTELPGGSPPQTVALSPFQVAAVASELISNTATSTVHAATLNTTAGLITTEALTTAAGATYTFTLTNSLLTTSVPAPTVVIKSGTNTAGGFQLVSVTNGSGNCVIVLKNSGTTAYNGTILIAFHI